MRKQADLLFHAVSLATLVIALAALAVLVFDIVADGGSRLNWQFLTNIASRHPEEAGRAHRRADPQGPGGRRTAPLPPHGTISPR